MQYSIKDIPKISPFKDVAFPDFRLDYLSNGIPVYLLSNPDYGVFKMEVNVLAGRFFEMKQGVSRTCANLLREGTITRTSAEIAKEIDFFGASMHLMGGMDVIKLELFSTSKYFARVVAVAADVLKEPAFPEKELDNYIKRTVQKLQVDLAKNDVFAFRNLTSCIFGHDHPYGYNTEEETLQAITVADLKEHFDRNFRAEKFSIILAGGIPDDYREQLEALFGNIPKSGLSPVHYTGETIYQPRQIRIEGKQKYQSSIKMGIKMFNRNHPDYAGVYFLSILLGGYFGSRLMQNIREDKGLTYDIYSTVDCMRKDGYFMLSAEVDSKSVKTTLQEIKNELDKLRKVEVDEEELRLIKNYIKGNLLTMLNGPINSIELIRLLAIYDLQTDFFYSFLETIEQMNAETILKLSDKYLDYNHFNIVICGNKTVKKIVEPV